MFDMMYMGVNRMQNEIRTPWAIFSGSEIRVRGGPDTQVWWVKLRARTLEGMTRALVVAEIILKVC